MEGCKKRDVETNKKLMTARSIAQENKRNFEARKEESINNNWADKIKEDDLLKQPTQKYTNWIR